MFIYICGTCVFTLNVRYCVYIHRHTLIFVCHIWAYCLSAISLRTETLIPFSLAGS